MNQNRRAAEKLAGLTELLLMGTAALYLLVAAWSMGRQVPLTSWPREVSMLVVVVAAPLAGRWAEQRHPGAATAFLRLFLPICMLPLLYMGAVRVVEIAGAGRYVDTVLARADAVLLMHPGRTGPPGWKLGGPVEELASLFYLSYYPAIPAVFLWAWHKGGREGAARTVAALFAASLLCGLTWLWLPAGGYHPTGSPTLPPWGPFTALVRALYASHPHFAAEFPSEHVAHAVVLVLAARALGAGRVAWLWAAAVAWSTVYGQYHYAVDGLAGFAVGSVAGRFALATGGLPEPSRWRLSG